METRLSVFMFVIFGLVLDFVALSQYENVSPSARLLSSPPAATLSPLLPPAPSPPPATQASRSGGRPAPAPSPPPATRASRSSGRPAPAPAPAPAKHAPASNQSRNDNNSSSKTHQHPPPLPSEHNHQMNRGEKIGLTFAGFAAILQIGVVGMLVYKRNQLLRSQNKYENFSS